VNLSKQSAANMLLAAVLLGVPACSSDSKPSNGKTTNTVMVEQGTAGGVFEDKFTVTATVSDIDHVSRHIALTSENGDRTSFKVGPEVRNFDQIQQGDKVTGTVTERMTVYVRGPSEDPTVTHASALARTPKGAMPGIMVSDAYEATGTVTSIDRANRKATVQFAGGKDIVLPVRSDVNLSRYNVGDTVVVQVVDTLSLIVRRP